MYCNSAPILPVLPDSAQIEGRSWTVTCAWHDADGKYISSFNYYLRLLSVFFRWLLNSNSNRNKSEDLSKWETPAFLRIKTKKPLQDSPYGINDIWELEDVLPIVSYEPELRNRAIITLLPLLPMVVIGLTNIRLRMRLLLN